MFCGTKRLSLNGQITYTMNRSFTYMARCILSALPLFYLAAAEPASADAVIRITGDRTPAVPNNSGGSSASPPPSSVSGNSIIRIIGDKQRTVQKPASGPAALPEPIQSASAKHETCINDDRVAEILLNQRLDSLKTDVERKAAGNTEQNRLEQGKDERENAAALQATIEQEQKQQEAGKTKKTRQAGKKPIRNRN